MSGADRVGDGPAGAGEPAVPSADLAALTFEQLLERLETITGQLSSGEVGIERAADLYEEAGGVYEAARQRLEAVQARIAALQESDRP
ncbi:MAG TPA: exodeoxyribonuclease VII small subunit [Acidimicrobiales bacterium]|nr:exodeoxyribonuclease VII small subunit [Acidimicrobiales bacterium]